MYYGKLCTSSVQFEMVDATETIYKVKKSTFKNFLSQLHTNDMKLKKL